MYYFVIDDQMVTTIHFSTALTQFNLMTQVASFEKTITQNLTFDYREKQAYIVIQSKESLGESV